MGNNFLTSLGSLLSRFSGFGGGSAPQPNAYGYSGTGMGGAAPRPWSLGSNAPMRQYNQGYSLGGVMGMRQRPGTNLGGQMYQGNNATKRNAAAANAGRFRYNSGYSQ